MGAFASKGTVRVTVPEREKEYIEIKTALSMREQDHLMDVLMLVRNGMEEQAVRIGSYHQALMEATVVGWHLLDKDGEPVPFKLALIGDLDPDDALVDKMLGEIAERFPLGGKKKSGD